VIVGAAVAVSSWVVLLVLLGNVGLQQAVSLGPLSSNQAVGYLIVMLWAGVVAIAAGPRRPAVVASVALILVLDFCAALGGVLLVGELGLKDFLSVMLVVTAVGLQPLGFVTGALIRGRIQAHRAVT
jgi:hypothetical protein